MRKINYQRFGIICAILSATLYSLNAPFSKLLLNHIPPIQMAGYLYIGSGIGMFLVYYLRKKNKKRKEEKHLEKKDLPFVFISILLDIIAPICLMLGLKSTSAANVSLLSDFEIVSTAIIAIIFFKEKISIRLWIGIISVTIACFILSLEDSSSFKFSNGSILVLISAICWGFDNNCTKKISDKDPLEIVFLKGLLSGVISLLIGFITEPFLVNYAIFVAMIVGFIVYGFSIYIDIYAQRILGATRTSAYYSITPFIGTSISLIIFSQKPHWSFWIGLIFMIIGAYLCSANNELRIKHKSISKNSNKIEI